MKKFAWIYPLLIAAFCACDDMDDKDETIAPPLTQETGTTAAYVLSEGLFNLNNSSLMRHTFADNRTENNYFRNVNKRGLGDTANDMGIYGSKLYIVVNVSSQIEVVDLATGKSLKQIPVLTENGSSRQPRYIAFHKNKAYVCSFDGTVARIDTASLAIEAYAAAGRNPDGICAQNDKLYVSNSGGLDNPDYDNTVSVIDIASFSETRKINVGTNPGKILADDYGNVYVAVRGTIVNGNYKLVKIDTQTDQVGATIDEAVINFAVGKDYLYMYNYNYSTKSSWVKVYSIPEERTEREQFITDGTVVDTPYGIDVNPYSGNVYITDAYDYQVKGDVLCFNPQGKLIFKLADVGLNPNKTVFTNRQTGGGTGGEEPAADPAYATKVLEYMPAPGQFMNTLTSAWKENFTADEVLALADERIVNKSMLSLGAWGGYITLGFDHRIANVEGDYDLRIYGNAHTSASGASAEPGIVMVSKDSNANGLPDDEWYELAGSEYGSEQEIRGYSITYYRPSEPLGDIKWKDNQGGEGIIPHNTFHTDNSYYPAWLSEDEITFSGTRLPDNAVDTGTEASPNWQQSAFGYGYADNLPNTAQGSLFKIEWAVDAQGQAVQLDGIDFVRIYSAVNQVCGWMGETSTEVTTVEDIHYTK